FALHELLLQKLSARDAVELCSQRGDPLFIGPLQACLADERRADDILMQRQVGRSRQRDEKESSGRRAGQGEHPRPHLEIADVLAPGDDDGGEFPAPAENACVIRLLHSFAASSPKLAETDYIPLGLTNVFAENGCCALPIAAARSRSALLPLPIRLRHGRA